MVPSNSHSDLHRALGVQQGTLKLHHHLASKFKPHVAFKRYVPELDFINEEESSLNGKKPVYFKLVALKAFTAKAGKEVLFAVDGSNTDYACLLQAVLPHEGSIEYEAEFEDMKQPLDYSNEGGDDLIALVPPKMRKSLGGRPSVEAGLHRESFSSFNCPKFRAAQISVPRLLLPTRTSAFRRLTCL
jgi:hypothetical protein